MTKLLYHVRKVPLFGQLFEVSGKSFRSALSEIFISTIFSTLPIWFFPLLASIFIANSPSLMRNILTSVDQGDLFIYSSALVGPLIFAITKNYAEWGSENPSANASQLGKLTFEFPYGTWFFLIAIAICMIAAVCFGLMRFSSMGLITAQFQMDNFLWVSGGMYLFALLCLFTVSIYRNELQDFSANANEDTQNFVDQWNSRNG